jgi:hypothetical protein
MRSFIKNVQKLLGNEKYNYFSKKTYGGDDVEWSFRVINSVHSKSNQGESQLRGWYIFLHGFLFPILKYCYSDHKELFQEILTSFCLILRKDKIYSFLFFIEDFDSEFYDIQSDFLASLPNVEKSIFQEYLYGKYKSQ